MSAVERLLFNAPHDDSDDRIDKGDVADEEVEESEEYELPLHTDFTSTPSAPSHAPVPHDVSGSSADPTSCKDNAHDIADVSTPGQHVTRSDVPSGPQGGPTNSISRGVPSSSIALPPPPRVSTISRSVACGSDVPMATESQVKYDELFRRTAMAAVSLFPPFSVQAAVVPTPAPPPRHLQHSSSLLGPEGRTCSSPRNVSVTQGTKDQWAERLEAYLHSSVSGRSPSRGRASAAVGAGASVPVASGGAPLMSASASAYVLRQEVLQVIDTLACDALAAKEALEQEHRHELAEQQVMWGRVVGVLRQEVASLQHALELERSSQHVSRLQAAIQQQQQQNGDERGQHHSMSSTTLPPLTARSPMHHHHRHRDEVRKRAPSPDSSSDGALTAQRIAEALVHLMNKRPLAGVSSSATPSGAPSFTRSPRSRRH